METFKIVVLGASGSGKTVFLASLYKQLAVQRDRFGFHLEIDTMQKQKLVQGYEQIASTEQEWPGSTDRSQHKSWKFACCVQDDEQQIHKVMDFEYLDYSGGTITNALTNEEIADLDRAIEEADALLCLLDGQKVLALMQGQKMGYQLLQKDLPNILPYLKADKPVHFVLTKWDLFLADEHYMQQCECDLLKPARDFLLKTDESLKSIVHKKARKHSVRLIPISAVGENFAKFENGQMKKFGKNPAPMWVEMPLVSVLFDKFKTRLEQLRDEADKIQADPEPDPPPVRSFMARLLVSVVGKAGALSFLAISDPGPVPGPVIIETVGTAIDILAERLQKKIEAWENKPLRELERRREEALRAVQDEESALDSTLNCFYFQFRKLQETFPSSDFDKA